MQELYLGEQKYHTSYISEKNELLLKKIFEECIGLLKQKSEQRSEKKKSLKPIMQFHNKIAWLIY